jgi:hypothetical protein
MLDNQLNSVIPPCKRLELLHEFPAYSPHSSSLAVYVHGHGGCQASHLNATNGDEHAFGSIYFKPVVDEQGEDKAVENV